MYEALSAEAAMVEERPGRLREFWFYFRENRGAVIGLSIFAVFAFLALFGPWIAPHDPTAQFRSAHARAAGLAGRRRLDASSSAPTRSAATCSRV